MISDLLNMAKAISTDYANYESRLIGRDEVKGLDVSTCYTSDMGYETALLDGNGAHPVERYSSKSEAITGHEKWKKWAKKNLNQVTKLGYGELVENKIITLNRRT